MEMKVAAASFRQDGYAIVWLHGDSKLPRRRGWRGRSEEPEHYEEGDALGIQCGAPSGNVVCIDLDSPAALALADTHLPETDMVEGRPGRPRSHRWYRVTDIPEWATSKLSDGGVWSRSFKRDNAEILGFKGTGTQAVVPPSLHPSGERREWQACGAPAEVPFMDLWSAVLRVATECGYVPTARDQPPAPGELSAIDRAAAYIGKIESVEGHGGDNALWRAARALVNDFALDREAALPMLLKWNETNARPAWDRGAVERKLEEALAAPPTTRPRGHLLVGGNRPYYDPRRLAAEFPGTWRYWHEALCRYDGARYTLIPEAEVCALLRSHIGEAFDRAFAAMMAKTPADGKPPKRPLVTRHLVNEVLAELQSSTLIPGAFALPCMLPDGRSVGLLAMKNGLLDVKSGELQPHSPEWFSTVAIPYPFDPGAVDTILPDALRVWFDGDAERIALAQEWAGYLLTRSTDAQAFMLLTGEGGNGKGSYAAALEAMLGPENLSYLPWEALGQRFQLAGTLGKLLNVSDDIGDFDRSAEGTLKWYVGGKPLSFERKGCDPFTAVPTARLMLACNQPPRIADRSEGVWRRMLVLPFDTPLPRGAVRRGMDKAEWWAENASMPGVLNWALVGLRRLEANEFRFTQPERSGAVKEALRVEFNPALAFLRDNVVADPGGKDITAADLHARYREWASAGSLMPLSVIQFSKVVQKEFGIGAPRIRNVVGKHAKYWHGVRWRDPKRDGCGMPWAEVLDWMAWAIREGRTIRIIPEDAAIWAADGIPLPSSPGSGVGVGR